MILLLWTEYVLLKFIFEALTLGVSLFGDRAIREIIKVK